MNPVLIRRAMLFSMAIVAITSAVLSYNGIRTLAYESGIGPLLSYGYPICLDGMLVAGSLVVLNAEAKGTSKTFGWLLTGVGVGGSVTANAWVVEGLAAQITHAAPPIMLALTLEALLHVMRNDVVTAKRAEAAAALATQKAAEAEAKALEEAETLRLKEATVAERARLKAERAAAPKGPLKTVRPAPFTITADQVLAFTSQGMSYQEAADALTKKHGRQITKARVNRAMKAAGLVESKTAAPSNQAPVEAPSWV